MQTDPKQTPAGAGDLIHPSQEEWMSYLYGESPRPDRTRLAAHLQICATCQAQVHNWRSAMTALDSYKLSAAVRRPEQTRANVLILPMIKWAAAAGLMLLLGFGLGRAFAPDTAEMNRWRAGVQAELRQELQRDLDARLEQARARLLAVVREQQQTERLSLLAAADDHTKELLLGYTAAFETARSEEQQQLIAAWEEREAQRQRELMTLRKDLETVAVVTDVSLRNTERQLTTLANYAQPPGESTRQLPWNPLKE